MPSIRTCQVGGPPAPVRLYTGPPAGTISVEYAACLDCGTCLAIAAPGALKWHYPRGGFGVQSCEG